MPEKSTIKIILFDANLIIKEERSDLFYFSANLPNTEIYLNFVLLLNTTSVNNETYSQFYYFT